MIDLIKSYFISLYQWFVEHQDPITLLSILVQIVSLVAAIVLLIKNLKGTKNNTSSTDKLNETLENTNSMSQSVVNLDGSVSSLKTENESLRTKLAETEEALLKSNKELANKLNAIIEVQSIVYSTIRDDGVRQTVNTILNNARYSEKNFKEELENKIEEFKQTYSTELKSINDKFTNSIDQVAKQLSATDIAKVAMETKSKVKNNNLRY